MGRHVVKGNPPIAVTIRKTARARRLSLRISRSDGRVTLTMPFGVPEREATAFIDSRESWLRMHLTNRPELNSVAFGSQIPFRGESLMLVAGPVRRATLQGNSLILPDDPDRVAHRVQAFLKLQARDRLAEASDRYSRALGRPYRKIALRDTKSRWGSCTSQGDLMYNWRLIMAPPEVLDYVAAHEVAHLQEMNHSSAFWDVVENLFPDHARCRRWLKSKGETLHRVRFGD